MNRITAAVLMAMYAIEAIFLATLLPVVTVGHEPDKLGGFIKGEPITLPIPTMIAWLIIVMVGLLLIDRVEKLLGRGHKVALAISLPALVFPVLALLGHLTR